MARTFLLLALSLGVLAGCTDSLGIGGDCAAEMASVRFQHGQPDDTRRGVESERWQYGRSGNGFYYTFDWSDGRCLVDGPVSFDRLPAGEPRLLPDS